MHGIAAGSSWRGGAWLGFGVAAKLYPATLIPAAARAGARPARVLAGSALLLAIFVLPFAPLARSLADQVVGYQAGRGIQVESTWGAALLMAGRAGAEAEASFGHGAYEVTGPAARALRPIALALSLAALAAALPVALLVPKGDVPALATAGTGLVALTTGLATVFSPQYLLWGRALAVAVCARRSPGTTAAVLLVPAAALTQAVYPLLYDSLLQGVALPGSLLAARNLLVLAVGVLCLAGLMRRGVDPSEPALLTTAA